MKDNNARIMALEILVFAGLQQLDKTAFLQDLAQLREISTAAFQNTLLTDEEIAQVDARLDAYLRQLNLLP